MDWRIGVIRRQDGTALDAPPTVMAVAAFADAVRSRHAPRTLYAGHLDLTLAEPPVADRGDAVHPAPQINLVAQLTFNDRGRFSKTTQVMVAPWPQRAGFGETQARALFERLFSRRARISALDERGPALPPDIVTPAAPRSVDAGGRTERVLPRPAAPTPAPAGPTPRLESAAIAADWGSPIAPPVQSKPIVLAAPEVRRVADQVIREIDHRISARRERIGER